MNRLSWTSIPLMAALAVSAFASRAHADQAPCGPIQFQGDRITVAQPLAATQPLADDTRACLVAVAKEVEDRPYLRSLTVVVRLPDDQRKNGAGLAMATAMRDVLVQAGAPAHKVSAVAPAVGRNQQPGIQLVYTERRAGRAVAKLAVVEGTVSVGRTRAAMQSVSEGENAHAYDYLATAASSRAVLRLADGSSLRVQPATLLRLGTVDLDPELRRHVRIEVLDGAVEVLAASAKDGSTFDMVTRAAVAGVRGTQFRVTWQDDARSRVETLEGTVELGNQSGAVPVPAAHGSRADAAAAPEPARLLPAAPMRLTPLQATSTQAPPVSWEAVPKAAGYVVEFARNAQFTRGVVQMQTTATTATATLAEARWYWRVSAVDADGFVGMPSKVYSFLVSAAVPEPAAP